MPSCTGFSRVRCRAAYPPGFDPPLCRKCDNLLDPVIAPETRHAAVGAVDRKDQGQVQPEGSGAERLRRA